MSTCTRDVSGLGIVIFLEPLHDDTRTEIVIPLYVVPEPNDETVQLMNRAAQRIEWVLGVERAKHYPGISLGLVLVGTIDESTIPTILEMFIDNLETQYQQRALRPDVTAAMAIHASQGYMETRRDRGL